MGLFSVAGAARGGDPLEIVILGFFASGAPATAAIGAGGADGAIGLAGAGSAVVALPKGFSFASCSLAWRMSSIMPASCGGSIPRGSCSEYKSRSTSPHCCAMEIRSIAYGAQSPATSSEQGASACKHWNGGTASHNPLAAKGAEASCWISQRWRNSCKPLQSLVGPKTLSCQRRSKPKPGRNRTGSVRQH